MRSGSEVRQSLDRLGVRVVALLVVGGAAVLRRDGEAPSGLGQGVGDETKGGSSREAAECGTRASSNMGCEPAPTRQLFAVQRGFRGLSGNETECSHHQRAATAVHSSSTQIISRMFASP